MSAPITAPCVPRVVNISRARPRTPAAAPRPAPAAPHPAPPAAAANRVAVAASLLLALAMVQLGLAVIRRDGKSLARVLLGTGQFAVVWAGGIAYMVGVFAASRGLAHALMGELLGVQSWGQWDPLGGFSAQEITDAVVATVLGLLGILLVFSSIGYLLVMITVGASTVVLAATGPIAAAGLVSDAGQSWFWKWL